MRRARLDAELVRRGFARSRAHAAELVAAGLVSVGDRITTKPATAIGPNEPLRVNSMDADPGFVSRGGHKLAGAVAAFVPDGLQVSGRRCLDAGASTGGFTDVLLRSGAASVVAVDVGYGQLAWPLRTDERVTVVERTNVRDLRAGAIEPAPELVVGDLSFISLALVLPPLRECATPDADFVLLVKPQFEVGRERVGAGGVVRDPETRSDAVRAVAVAAAARGLGVRGVVASPLPGPAGNVEYFLWLRAGAPPLDDDALARAVAEGPQ
jgi:23S rRNA (cytidine1920-2'-O)/16S rRNA (cytidine1409-2'-O)-methyltransferase